MENDDGNPYLALRAAKIARNEARLRELGLLTNRTGQKHRATNAAHRVSQVKDPPRKEGSRRSARHTKHSPPAEKTITVVRPANPSRKEVTKPKGASARSTSVNVGNIVGQFLGHAMDKKGKDYVVQRVSGSQSRVSFNKYSGIQEWANEAMFLWVNLGKPGESIVNEFLNKGRQVKPDFLWCCLVCDESVS